MPPHAPSPEREPLPPKVASARWVPNMACLSCVARLHMMRSGPPLTEPIAHSEATNSTYNVLFYHHPSTLMVGGPPNTGHKTRLLPALKKRSARTLFKRLELPKLPPLAEPPNHQHSTILTQNVCQKSPTVSPSLSVSSFLDPCALGTRLARAKKIHKSTKRAAGYDVYTSTRRPAQE